MKNTLINFETFQNEADFSTVMSSGGLDGWNNYVGEDFSCWLCGPCRSRDSDSIAESNFDEALNMLGEDNDNVQIERCSHWACGWFERILVKRDSPEALKLYDIYKALENYPLLNEDDYSRREYEKNSEYAEGAKNDLAKALSKHFGVKNSKKLIDIAYDLNMADQGMNGSDSCINIYSGRRPDKYDMRSLKSAMADIAWKYKNSRVFKALDKAIENYLVEEKSA